MGALLARLSHLVRRFFFSLRPGGPDDDDVRWLESHLSGEEAALLRRMSRPDRRHAVWGAVELQRILGREATREEIAAAALHDVGKYHAGLPTMGRVVATTVTAMLGERTVRRWAGRSGLAGRIGTYACHAEIGAEDLEAAGSDPLIVSWALEHHRPPEEWTLPRPLGEALLAADAR